MKTLDKDRNRRYESANGLAMDVQRYLADETVQACPPSSWYRLRKFVRRNRGRSGHYLRGETGMKTHRVFLIALAVVVWLAGPSARAIFAQEVGSADVELHQINPFGPGALLRRGHVQTKLKLTHEQRAAFQEKMAKILETHREAMAKLGGASADEKKGHEEAIWKGGREAADKMFAGLLTPAQLKRLKQIQYQEEGFQVFTYLEVRKALELTDEQATQAKVIAQEFMDANSKLQAPKRFRASDFDELMRTYQGKMQNLLNERQKAAWKTLVGEPYVPKL